MPNLLPARATFRGLFHSMGDLNNDWINFDFNTRFKPSIDACASIGANLFVYFGSAYAAHLDIVSYKAARKVVANYLASKGMYGLSYSMGPTMDQITPFVSLANAITAYAADLEQQSRFTNIIADVSIDEPWGSDIAYGGSMTTADIITFLTNTYNAAKAVVPSNFAISTCPNPAGQIADVFNYTGANKVLVDSVAAINDFLTYHPFYAMANADFAAVSAAYPNKNIGLTSCIFRSNGAGDLAAVANGCLGAVGVGQCKSAGWFLTTDLFATVNGAGVFNNDYTPRIPKTTLFEAHVPAIPNPVRQVRRFPGSPRLNQYLQWGY